MSRKFSIVRRKPHVVDVVIPLIAGVDTYRLKWAANFDATHNAFVEAGRTGYVDANVNAGAIHVLPGEHCRIVFDPTTFSIPDGQPFWMKLAEVTGGVEGTNSPTILVLPAGEVGNPAIIIKGNAPVGVSVANSLEVHLPRLMTDLKITNQDAANPLYVAFEAGGAETKINGNNPDAEIIALQGNVASLFVRSETAPVAFSATMTPAFSR